MYQTFFTQTVFSPFLISSVLTSKCGYDSLRDPFILDSLDIFFNCPGLCDLSIILLGDGDEHREAMVDAETNVDVVGRHGSHLFSVHQGGRLLYDSLERGRIPAETCRINTSIISG